MERDYNEVFEISKKRHFSRVLLIILISIMLIASIIYVGYVIINNVSGRNYDVFIASKDFYAVTLASSATKADVDILYGKATAIGASGYVFKSEDNYYLLALIYPTEDMAKSVVASNQSDNFTLDILKISLPQLSYNLDNFAEKDITTINEISNYIVDMASVLYELTIAVQIGNISSIACASTINNHKGDMIVYQAKLDSILSVDSDENVLALQQKLIKLVNIMDKMVNELLSNTNMGNVMKYNFCEYIFELCSN